MRYTAEARARARMMRAYERGIIPPPEWDDSNTPRTDFPVMFRWSRDVDAHGKAVRFWSVAL